MTQEIVTYIILAAAFLYAGYKVFSSLRPFKRKHGKGRRNNTDTVKNGCGTCTSECMLRDMVAKDSEGCPLHERIGS